MDSLQYDVLPSPPAHLPTATFQQTGTSSGPDLVVITGWPRALLQTKLSAPRVGDTAGLLARPRLSERMRAAGDARLILVCAPAGYGKTTLVAQTVAEDGGHVAWLSIDERDNDSARFVAYLVGALQQVVPTVGDAVTRVRGVTGDGSSWDVLESVLNELAESTVSMTLVIDDYHRIEDPVVHNLMNYLVEFLPPQLRLVVISRFDPPLPLARMRARGDLLEIRAQQLSFTRDETAQFLAIENEGPIQTGLLARVHSRTEGWIVALQLLNLLLRGEGEERRNVILEGFIGNRRHVAEFLLDEVLRQRQATQRSFLLRTAILTRLNGPLCDAITGGTDGQATLHALERAGIPLFALDDQRRWYRYHHLLSEFLVQQLADELGETGVDQLHRRASTWLSEHGQLDEAIDHSLAAHDWERAIGLLYEAGIEAAASRRTMTLRRWLEALPDRYLKADPILALWFGRMLSWTCKPRRANSLLEQAELTLLERGTDHLVGDVRIARAWCAIHEGRVSDALALSLGAIELEADGPVRERSMANFTFGAALLRDGHARESLAQMERAKAMHPLPAIASVELGRALDLQGHLGEAERLIRLALMNDNPTDSHRRGHIWLSDIYRAWNDLERAGEQLERAEELATFLEAENFFPSLEVARARLLWASGHTEWALTEVSRGIARSRLFGYDAATAEAEAVRASFWLALGRLDEAEAWRRTAGIHPGSRPDHARLEAARVSARVLIATGVPDHALVLLAHLRGSAVADGRIQDAGHALALEALAHQALHRPEDARRALVAAIACFEPGGNLRWAADHGEGLVGLLRGLAASGAHLDYVRRLLDVAGSSPPPSTVPTGGLIDPLSNRELEVLRLVSVGLSNREISDQLFISVPTVKRHISTILDKLTAKSRTQAVSLARSFQLI